MADENSPLHFYRSLISLRNKNTFQRGAMTYGVTNKQIFSFFRHARNEPSYLIAINFGSETSTDDYRLQLEGESDVPHSGTVVLAYREGDTLSLGRQVELSKVTLHPKDVLVITY